MTVDLHSTELSDIAVLRSCTDRELSKIKRHCVGVHVPPGRVLCHEGELGRECFVIADGEAAVTATGHEIARLGKGSFFGEMAVLDGRVRTATVTAITEMDLLVFTTAEFNAVLREVPTFAHNVMATLASRLRLADRSLTTAGLDQPPSALFASS